MSRRQLLAMLGLGLVAACTSGAPEAGPTVAERSPRRPVASPSAQRGTSPPPEAGATADPATPTSRETTPGEVPGDATPTPEAPYEVGAEEVFPEAKRLAADVVTALLTYGGGTAARDLVAATIDRVGSVAANFDRDAAEAAVAPLVDGRGSAGVVVYPQLGGLDPAPETGRQPSRCSVMVVADQQIGDDRFRRCIDVRLRTGEGVWRWEGLGDVGGTPVPRPGNLSRPAVIVLDHPGIDLPDSARWDIHAGIVHEDLLKVMVLIATRVPYRVTALRSGHPERVFGQTFRSNHSHGRAVDIWSVDGQAVVLQGPRNTGDEASRSTPVHLLAEALLEETTVDEVGSPWDFDGPPTRERPQTRTFTNTVHADHLHVAFDAG